MHIVDEQERERLNSGVAPVSPDELDEQALSAWMGAHIEGFKGPLRVRRFKGGQSNPTYQVATPTHTYVVRRKPPGALLPSAHAVDREHRILAALWPTGFPVARPRGLCTDPAVIGGEFYVMDMVEGRIFWDQSLPHAPLEGRRPIYGAQLETLARLHGLDPTAVGLADFGKPGNYLARQVGRWTKQYRASETERIPHMDALMGWLPTALPPEQPATLVHGDYRLDNMIFAPESPRVTAVLDWELSTLGDPLADFSYLLTNWLQAPLADIRDLDRHGVPTLEAYVDDYCRVTGRDGMPNLDWYLAYNLFRRAAICQGVVGRVRDGTAHHPQAAAMAARVPVLAENAYRFAQRI